MAKAKIVRDSEGRFYGIRFNCPGCAASEFKSSYATVLPVRWLPQGETVESPNVSIKDHWEFNGDFDRPTFSPSVNSHFDMPEEDGYPAIHFVCHSFVRDGRIEFLSDCTHPLAGQTVELPEIEG